jgi:hypothetical protein
VCPAPALPASFRGWMHAPACGCIHWGLCRRTGEQNPLRCKHNTLPRPTRGLEWGRQRHDPDRQPPNTGKTRRRRAEKATARCDPLPTGIVAPTLTAALSAPFRAPLSRVAGLVTSLPLRRTGGQAASKRNPPSLPLRSLPLTVLAASAQVLPFFLRPFSLMSGLELTGRLPCPGSGRPPLPALPCASFPAVPGKVGEKGSRAGEAP